jgi:hypothetical protein
MAKGGLTVSRLLIQLGNRSVDLAIDLCDRQVERVVLPEMELQQETMMIGEPAVQRASYNSAAEAPGLRRGRL